MRGGATRDGASSRGRAAAARSVGTRRQRRKRAARRDRAHAGTARARARAFRAEVHLYRKLPGKGEGRQRITKKFSLTAALPPTQTHVDVYLAESTTSRPTIRSFRLVARVRL
jgi:hypothetical protein